MVLKDYKALIMAAGYGTRLEPLTLAVPKPMVPIVNKPTMLHNIELIRKYGIREIAANIHYHPEQIKNYFGSGYRFNVHLSYSYEEELLGTAGGVKKMAKDVLRVDRTFLVLSSDALTDINLKKIIDFHHAKKALVTVALMQVEDPSQFGVAVLDDENRVVGFQEKPVKEDAESAWANAGIYVVEPELLDLIPKNTFYDFGKSVFPELAARNEKIFGYRMIEYWSDVGSLSQYHKANSDAMQGRVRLRIPGKRISSNCWAGKGVNIDPSAVFKGSVVLGNRVHIGQNVSISGETVIGDMCIIDDNAQLDNVVVWTDTYIGKKTSIRNSVVGAWCHLDSEVLVEEDAIIANRSHIRKGYKISANGRIAPDTLI